MTIIKPVEREPIFLAPVRKEGKVSKITVPKDFIETFKIKLGKTYKIRFLEEVGDNNGSQSKSKK